MRRTEYGEAVRILLKYADHVGKEKVSPEDLYGRVLAEDIVSDQNVPNFARSPYDGYAFRAEDTAGADEKNKVTLKVIENIRAGQVAQKQVESGTAVRLMTGAPIPEGADAVCKYEDTDFTDESVDIKQQYFAGDNIIKAGEDIANGALLAKKGTPADPAVSGIAASLGMTEIPVYKRPVAALLSTGDEVVDINEPLQPGKIRNSNRYTISGALRRIGFDAVSAGHAQDDVEDLYNKILTAELISDIIISTGGVSAGDFDLVPKAMEEAGYEIIVNGIAMKPGMACAYGVKHGRLMLALSGNPASALTNLQCICYPALRKLAGLDDHDHKMIRMMLKKDIKKTGKGMRFIRGVFSIEEGMAVFEPRREQGNIVISSAALCNAYACIPEGTAPLKTGETVEGFLI
ncbi:MAG: molybdopterin molybdotransferase MoeA [Lachnospiraceae bacterium]|nr:molybdopterin molybdotransferase MoeA [Lachnospiraceae bacterium]